MSPRSTPPRLDLNLMVSLLALIETESVTKAAERLSVGPQAMSASLARLRRITGDPLLVRAAGGMVRTPVADSLREPVEKVLGAFASTLADRRVFDPARDAAQFTVLASDYVTLVLLQGLLRVLATRAPRVRVSIRPVVPDFGDHMRQGHADLVVLPREIAGPARGLRAAPLFEDRFVCVVSKDNHVVGEEMTPQQFDTIPYIAYDGGAIPSGAQTQMSKLGLDRPADLTTRSFVVAALMVEHTDYMTVIHERLARLVAERADLRVVEPPFPLRPITETMFWSSRTDQTPAHRWLRDLLAETAAGLAPLAGPLGAKDAPR